MLKRLPSVAPRTRDALIAALGLCVGLLLVAAGTVGAGAAPRWVAVLPLLAMAGAELMRSSRPVWAVSVGAVALIGDVLAGSVLATVVMYTDVLYAAVVYRDRRTSAVLHLAGGAATLVLTLLAFLRTTATGALLVAVLCGLVLIAPVWTGDIVRRHRETAVAERLRAEQTALLAEMDRREAVVAERARMARELHDMVANHLSAIAIHATGAQSLVRRGQAYGGDGDPVLQALGMIRESSVQGLAEMRRVIGLLRSSGGGEADDSWATPRLEALGALLEHARSAGRGDRLTFSAVEQGAREGLPAPVELAAYRIVQESLTNALKHAAPGEVRLRLDYRPEAVTVLVESAYEPGGGRELPGAGAGLVGMAERAALLGGRFTAGPEGSRWVVRAVLPMDPGEGLDEA
ncbi:sensor histidine kinase [Streptomyces sp. NPDC092296]|uniref:sensor histidine kinase n=1 Tax=Streptomyces sp. NPDC092296 TaxID=3366012 RepID=UPI0038058285